MQVKYTFCESIQYRNSLMESCSTLVSASPSSSSSASALEGRCSELEMLSADSDGEEATTPLTPLAVANDGEDGEFHFHVKNLYLNLQFLLIF